MEQLEELELGHPPTSTDRVIRGYEGLLRLLDLLANECNRGF